jgi:Fic family protein
MGPLGQTSRLFSFLRVSGHKEGNLPSLLDKETPGILIPLWNSRRDRTVTSNRAGRFERQQPGGYLAFLPAPLPPADLEIGPELQALISRSDIELGRLDGAIRLVPDPDIFVFMYVRREAVLSSQIEGTQASLMDVLEYEAELEGAEQRVDVREISNYIAAMNHGLARLKEIPLSRRLLSEVHAVLMKDVRGGEPHKTPGEFRRSQNWIGGASPATARFVPPPWEVAEEAFAHLERFLHDSSPMPVLIKAGLAHAQFETIHPFLDGNGRIGRLLITFWLVEQRILSKPLLYPSVFLKENRTEYVDRLQAIRDDGAWEGWLAFFVDGIGQVAAEATARAVDIVRLRDQDRERVASGLGKRAPNGLALLDHLFRQPVVSAKTVQRLIDVSQPTASAIVKDLEQLGILHEFTGKQRYRLFAYDRYLQLFPGAADRG